MWKWRFRLTGRFTSTGPDSTELHRAPNVLGAHEGTRRVLRFFEPNNSAVAKATYALDRVFGYVCASYDPTDVVRRDIRTPEDVVHVWLRDPSTAGHEELTLVGSELRLEPHGDLEMYDLRRDVNDARPIAALVAQWVEKYERD